MVRPASKRVQFRSIIALLACIAAVTSTSAIAAGVDEICAAYDEPENAIIADVNSGCVSSSFRYLGNDLSVDVDEQTASISVSGGFKYKSPASKVATSDCMGGERLEIEKANVKPRRYSVYLEGRYLGVVDFTKSYRRQCLRGASKFSRTAVGVSVQGLTKKPLLNQLLETVEGPTIQEVVEPLMRNLAVTGEGRGSSLNLSIRKTVTGEPAGPSRAVARIEAHGLLDDSVSGVQYVVDFLATSNGWKAISMQRKQMCARGRNAGMWVKDQCT